MSREGGKCGIATNTQYLFTEQKAHYVMGCHFYPGQQEE